MTDLEEFVREKTFSFPCLSAMTKLCHKSHAPVYVNFWDCLFLFQTHTVWLLHFCFQSWCLYRQLALFCLFLHPLSLPFPSQTVYANSVACGGNLGPVHQFCLWRCRRLDPEKLGPSCGHCMPACPPLLCCGSGELPWLAVLAACCPWEDGGLSVWLHGGEGKWSLTLVLPWTPPSGSFFLANFYLYHLL